MHIRKSALVLVLAFVLAAAPLASAIPAGRPASADDPTGPDVPTRLVFMHHSCGQNWLADGNGDLGVALR